MYIACVSLVLLLIDLNSYLYILRLILSQTKTQQNIFVYCVLLPLCAHFSHPLPTISPNHHPQNTITAIVEDEE